MKNLKSIILMVILAVLLAVMLNPSWLPFLDEGKVNALQAEISAAFGTGSAEESTFTLAKLFTAVAVVIFMVLATTLVCFVLEKICAKKRRSQTVASLLTSVIKGVGAIVTVVWALSTLGVNLAAIFASLGVVSLILGFGVQSLIEDCVTGIFIILENQYNIGDIVVLEDFRGTVKKITMRTTIIEDAGGNLKIVNNSDIRNIQNRSRAASYAIATVGISYSADLVAVEKVLEAELPKVYERNPELFLEAPYYGGVQALGASSVDIRVLALVNEANIFVAQRCLNREVKLIFDANGIEIPFQQVVIHNAKD